MSILRKVEAVNISFRDKMGRYKMSINVDGHGECVQFRVGCQTLTMSAKEYGLFRKSIAVVDKSVATWQENR